MNLYGEPRLLLNFASQGTLKRLAWLDHSAWEVPSPPVLGCRREPSEKEDPIFPQNEPLTPISKRRCRVICGRPPLLGLWNLLAARNAAMVIEPAYPYRSPRRELRGAGKGIG